MTDAGSSKCAVLNLTIPHMRYRSYSWRKALRQRKSAARRLITMFHRCAAQLPDIAAYAKRKLCQHHQHHQQ